MNELETDINNNFIIGGHRPIVVKDPIRTTNIIAGPQYDFCAPVSMYDTGREVKKVTKLGELFNNIIKKLIA